MKEQEISLSEKIHLCTVVPVVALLVGEGVRCGQRHHLDVVVSYQSCRLIVSVVETIWAKTGFIHDHVCNVLSMLN